MKNHGQFYILLIYAYYFGRKKYLFIYWNESDGTRLIIPGIRKILKINGPKHKEHDFLKGCSKKLPQHDYKSETILDMQT